MSIRYFFLSASLAFIGCGSPDDTIDIVFDPCQPLTVATDSSDLRVRQSIEEAAALWNELAGTRLSFAETGSITVGLKPAPPAYFGLYDDERGVIIINENIADDRARTITLAHEVGHAMGLVHVKKDSERRSVMVPGNTETPPGDFDLQTLTAIWGACSP